MSEKTINRKQTGANVGPGDQTVAEMLNPGTAYLDYYAQAGPVTLNVFFSASGGVSGVVQLDFGPPQPLSQGTKLYTFNQNLQLTISNQSGQAKYGWIAVK